MIRILQQTTENLASNATKATLTSISSGVAVWGVPLPLFLQLFGIAIAAFSAIISALYLYALYVEKKRSNKKKEDQTDRALDLRERELESK